MAVPVLDRRARWERNLLGHMSLFSELPPEYQGLSEAERRRRVLAAKRALGDRLLVLGHNYQNDEIVSVSDVTGDSYQLSKRAAQAARAEHIVFCGVSFMAETADILTDGERNVVLPSMEASCPMAGMAEMVQVSKGWAFLEEVLGPERLVPVAYVNSYADLKAFVGENEGVICTSANADRAFRWAWERSPRAAEAAEGREPVIAFFPDKHLATNTALDLGVRPDEIAYLNPWKPDESPEAVERLRNARVVAWEGYCQVHDRFKPEHVREMRAEHPGVQVVVHPECRRDVVELADHVGSTSRIIEIVEQAPPGSSFAIGTEIHLVRRLARDHPDKHVVQLCGALCLDCNAMRQIQPEYLLWVLEELVEGRVQNRVKVPEDERVLAKAALERMLAL